MVDKLIFSIVFHQTNGDQAYIDSNLFCATEKLHVMLKEDGAIKTLLEMVKSGNGDVIAQIARGLANFAKCESRGIFHGALMSSSLHKM